MLYLSAEKHRLFVIQLMFFILISWHYFSFCLGTTIKISVTIQQSTARSR